jgi:hypothetical protein
MSDKRWIVVCLKPTKNAETIIPFSTEKELVEFLNDVLSSPKDKAEDYIVLSGENIKCSIIEKSILFKEKELVWCINCDKEPCTCVQESETP